MLQGEGGGASVAIAGDWRVDWSWELGKLLLLRLRNHRFLQVRERREGGRGREGEE